MIGNESLFPMQVRADENPPPAQWLCGAKSATTPILFYAAKEKRERRQTAQR